MSQDLRELFRKEAENSSELSMKKGHKDRFYKRLEKNFPFETNRRKTSLIIVKIAATWVVLFGLGALAYHFYTKNPPPIEVVNRDAENSLHKENSTIQLGDLSPDLKKVEEFYLASINYELSELEMSDGNKKLIDEFMQRLLTLNDEYEFLIKELNSIGPNNQTVTALIENLKLRLQLLYQLKEKLNELKTTMK